MAMAILVACATTALLIWAWSLFNWVWFRPKKLERCLRQHGLTGNSYKILFGDLKQSSLMLKQANSTPINLADDILPRVLPFLSHFVKDLGKNSFTWNGPTPRVNIMEPELIKHVLSSTDKFPKTPVIPLLKLLTKGLTSYKGEKWSKHRKIINPAFHMEKLKHMVPAMYLSCSEMMSKWENMVSANKDGSCELDMWPEVQTLIRDMVCRTAFGSNYKEGIRIFQLQKEQMDLVFDTLNSVYIPGWRFMPTERNKRLKTMFRDVLVSIRDMVNKRVEEMKAGEPCQNDLLTSMLESNFREIQKNGNDSKLGLTIEDIVEECRLFYLAGAVTTSSMVIWTLILLGVHQNWQQQAREEVLHVFGNKMPDYDGLTRLKTVTMILNEALRLYPPAALTIRTVKGGQNLGGLHLPAGVELLLPVILMHHDKEIWGSDAKEFKPERFLDGVSKATKSPQVSFFPFGWGPRICIGQNFAMLQAKMALATILRQFEFELSPSYAHAPSYAAIIQPQYGAPLILHKL